MQRSDYAVALTFFAASIMDIDELAAGFELFDEEVCPTCIVSIG
jgi:hypothetical protein